MNQQTYEDGTAMPPLETLPLKIAVDFDGTFNANPAMFCSLIGMMRKYGADVRLVTFRFNSGGNNDIAFWATELKLKVIFTEGHQKESFCAALGWKPDIWIDDDPRFIPAVEGLELLIQGCKTLGE